MYSSVALPSSLRTYPAAGYTTIIRHRRLNAGKTLAQLRADVDAAGFEDVPITQNGDALYVKTWRGKIGRAHV